METIGSFQTCIDFDHILKKRGNYSRGGNTAFSFGVSKLVVGSDEQDNLFHETYVLLHKGSGPIVYRAAALRSHLIK